VSFFDALRYVNWLHNGKPTGAQDATTTEDGAYTFSGPTAVGARNADAKFAVPNEDEWYKAAYYDPAPATYFKYPTRSNDFEPPPPVCDFPTPTPYRASCGGLGPYDVGGYTGSPSAYGTFDQGGNAWEWNETVIPPSDRLIRGGAFNTPNTALRINVRLQFPPATESGVIGFRVVPEPGAALGLGSGVAALLALAKRRRRIRIEARC
jgi:sulfatase modifying factor 1